MSRQLSRGSAGEYQADEQAGVARLHWRVSGRLAGRCHAAPLASIRQMRGQVSRGSVAEYQADERAEVTKSCPTVCNPIDGSPPASPVLGVLQARTLEWVAISFSNA